MNRKIRLLAATLPVAALLAAGPTTAQEQAEMSEAEMMKLWEEAAAPGEPHRFLEQFVGAWDTETTVWMGGPDSEPQKTTGSCKNEMIMDGRFLVQHMTGTFMGNRMTGMGITGYDNFKKKYVTYWIDNMGTAMYLSEGYVDRAGKALTTWGSMDEPTTGFHDKPVRYVTRIIDEDHHTFEAYDLHGGPDFKVFEIRYARTTSHSSNQ